MVKSGAGAAAGTENGEMTNIGYYNFEKAQENTSTNNSTNDNESNEQQNQATNKNESSQYNQTQNSNVDENNNTEQQNQAKTKALPESGEQSNYGLVTIIASVLLAMGSLLTFKRFSNNK